MCRINFNIDYTDYENDEVVGVGRYKLRTESNWRIFTFDVLNPQTPDININGEYDLEIQVQDSKGELSNTIQKRFNIPCETSLTPRLDPNQEPQAVVYRDQGSEVYSVPFELDFLDMDGLQVTNGQRLARWRFEAENLWFELISKETKTMTGDVSLMVEVIPQEQENPRPAIYLFPVTLENGVNFEIKVKYSQS